MRNFVTAVGRRGRWDRLRREAAVRSTRTVSAARSMSGMWFVVCIPKDDDESTAEKTNGPVPCKDAKKNNNSDVILRPVNGNLRHSEAQKNAINDDEAQGTVVMSTMKEALEDCLKELGIQDAVWNSRPEDKYYQVCFPCESGEDTDRVLHALAARGIGSDKNSTVGVVPCAVFYRDPGDDGYEDSLISYLEEEKKASTFKTAQQKFLKSVRARLTVAQVVEGVRAQGELNFDYVAFILLAGMIAALGLMDNSVVSIIAAMLVSPLMGPIMAITFGIRIRDKSLIKVGLRSEICGLLLCLLFGFFFGIIMAYWGDIEGRGSWSPNTWPNPEQTSRGQWRSLWVGGLVALPSGAGVAMAILGGNSACLVGVAISASLLPPSINCGTLWSLSLMKVFKSFGQDPVNATVLIPGTNMTRVVTTYPAFLAHSSFSAYYYDNANMHKECAVMAIISFCLTVVNILCIIVAGTVFLKIKEIAPEASMPRTQRFWKHDIPLAREYNRTFHEGNDLGQNFLKEWADISGMDPKMLTSRDPDARMAQKQTLEDILMDAEDDDVYQTVTRKIANHPGTNVARRMTMAALPAMNGYVGGSRSGSTDFGANPMAGFDVEGGRRNSRRPSHFAANMVTAFDRRASKSHFAYENPEPPSIVEEMAGMTPANLQHRRRSSVMRSYWPSPSRFSVSPVLEDDPHYQRRPSRLSRVSNRPPVLEEEQGEYSKI